MIQYFFRETSLENHPLLFLRVVFVQKAVIELSKHGGGGYENDGGKKFGNSAVNLFDVHCGIARPKSSANGNPGLNLFLGGLL